MSAPDDEITKSFALVMRFIADLSLRVETCRVLLRSQGVTDEQFRLVHDELKRRWDSTADAQNEQINEKRTAERLRQLLESAEGTKQ